MSGLLTFALFHWQGATVFWTHNGLSVQSIYFMHNCTFSLDVESVDLKRMSPLSSRKAIKQTKRKLLHFKPLEKELAYVLIANTAILERENPSGAEYRGRRKI